MTNRDFLNTIMGSLFFEIGTIVCSVQLVEKHSHTSIIHVSKKWDLGFMGVDKMLHTIQLVTN